MLSDQQLELLTAFVDGELSPQQRTPVLRLLEQSSEAREVLRQLQENAHKLKQLPRRKMEPSLVDQVMQAIAEQKSMPKQPVKWKRARRRWMPYVAATLAASLLALVIGIVCWKAATDGPVEAPKENIARLVPEVEGAPKPPLEIVPKKKRPAYLDSLVDGVVRDFGAPPVDAVYVAQFVDLKDAKGASVDRLAAELDGAKTAVHVELTINKGASALAMDRLRGLLKERGIQVVADPSVTKSINDKKQPRAEYLVYAENLTPDDVAKLMSELGQAYVVSQGNNQRTEQPSYKTLAVKAIGSDDKQQLGKLLGVNPGAMVRNKNAKPAAKRNPVAVLLPSTAGKAPSAEVRQFVERRQPQPGTLQVLIRIRQE